MFHLQPAPFIPLGIGGGVQTIVSIHFLYIFAFAPYLRLICSRARPGAPRLLLSLPVIVFGALSCFFFSHEELVLRICSGFILGWLGTFKVLAFCLDRGPLIGSWNHIQFSLLLLLPVYSKPRQDRLSSPSLNGHEMAGQENGHANGTNGARPLKSGPKRITAAAKPLSTPKDFMIRAALKAALIAFIVFLLLKVELPKSVKYCVYAFGLYAFLGCLMETLGLIGLLFLDMDLAHPFDHPWMCTSLTDFWGCRWNLTTSAVLRALVHDVVMDGSFVKPKSRKGSPSIFRRISGICLTFIVSGLAHEIILWTVQPDGRSGWKISTFFHLQGPLMTAEVWLAKQEWTWKPPSILCRLLTLAILYGTAFYTFFPAVDDTNLASRMADAIASSFSYATATI